MNKLLLTLLSFISLSFAAQSQDKILFYVHHKPELIYEQTDNTTSNITIKYSGSEEFMEKMKEKGMENPSVKVNKSTTKTKILTGKQKGNVFPITMEFVETNNTEGKKPIPDGTLLYAHCEIGQSPSIDSISSNEMSEEVKTMMLPALQSVFEQIKYPKKEVKIGESFTNKEPLSIPLGGTSLDMEITSTYKLLSIKNGMALFDIQQVYSMKTKVEEMKMSATGNGKGTITYDIANNYIQHHELKYTMNMLMKTDQFDMGLQMVNSTIQDVKISPNKK